MERGRRVKVRSGGGRKWCYRMGERLVIEHDGICRGGRMH